MLSLAAPIEMFNAVATVPTEQGALWSRTVISRTCPDVTPLKYRCLSRRR